MPRRQTKKKKKKTRNKIQKSSFVLTSNVFVSYSTIVLIENKTHVRILQVFCLNIVHNFDTEGKLLSVTVGFNYRCPQTLCVFITGHGQMPFNSKSVVCACPRHYYMFHDNFPVTRIKREKNTEIVCTRHSICRRELDNSCSIPSKKQFYSDCSRKTIPSKGSLRLTLNTLYK